jgi:hypothetical protein
MQISSAAVEGDGGRRHHIHQQQLLLRLPPQLGARIKAILRPDNQTTDGGSKEDVNVKPQHIAGDASTNDHFVFIMGGQVHICICICVRKKIRSLKHYTIPIHIYT